MRKKDHNTALMAAVCIVLTILAAVIISYIVFRGPGEDQAGEDILSGNNAPGATGSPENARDLPAVDYNRMETDSEYKELMNKRKEKFGVDESMDLIVKSDEDIRIGDSVIPMREILEKIRLRKEGGVVEQDISKTISSLSEEDRKKLLMAKLEEIRAKSEAVEQTLQTPEVFSDHARYQRLIGEYSALEAISEDYEKYLTIGREIRRHEALLKKDPETVYNALKEELKGLEQEISGHLTALANMFPERAESLPDLSGRRRFLESLEGLETELEGVTEKLNDPAFLEAPDEYEAAVRKRNRLKNVLEKLEQYREAERKLDDRVDVLSEGAGKVKQRLERKIADLRVQQDMLENELFLRTMPVDMENIYGIYVVQPGDNVWNIHFDFLKEYFDKKGITLYSGADEPDANGTSSGVGKILKFSETMVFIYNVREKKLGVNLNLIHPLSKIVVFNLGRAFSLLDQIDYSNISKIQFDGETLWLPAEE